LSRRTTARREPCAVAAAAVISDHNTGTIATVLTETSWTPVTGKCARMTSPWIYVMLYCTAMMSLVNGKYLCNVFCEIISSPRDATVVVVVVVYIITVSFSRRFMGL